MAATIFPIPFALIELCSSPIKRGSLRPIPLNFGWVFLWLSGPSWGQQKCDFWGCVTSEAKLQKHHILQPWCLGMLTLKTQPQCYKEAQAALEEVSTERNQSPQSCVPAELLANSRHQDATIWVLEVDLPTPGERPQLQPHGAGTSWPHWVPSKLLIHKQNKWLSFFSNQ